MQENREPTDMSKKITKMRGTPMYQSPESYSGVMGRPADWWGLGMGRALTKACIELAKQAGYLQLELSAVADNGRAIALYASEGFVEYGRNPRGFRSRLTGWQALVYMRRELDE